MAGQKEHLLADISVGEVTGPPANVARLQEQSPAYKALHDAGLIVHDYRVHSHEDLTLVRATSSISKNLGQRCTAYTAGLLVGGIIYDSFVKQFTVMEGYIRPAQHQDGSYFFYGPGVHRISGVFIKLGNPVPLKTPKIIHGDRAIVTVAQGYIGLAQDRGQPIILAPGMHQWQSSTMQFEGTIDLSHNVIRVGPFTLLTVDEGYAAITQDNGQQKILPGGATHMLTHRNWKFEKFISLKIQTDDLKAFRATTADKVVLETTATVNWCVRDPELAARMSAETMHGGEGATQVVNPGGSSTPKLQADVLKQAVASLAMAIGKIHYSEDLHVAANQHISTVKSSPASKTASAKEASAVDEDVHGVAQIFSAQQKTLATEHANRVCSQYGVSIISINIITACPADKKLDEAMSVGAVAAAAALQSELEARGNAKAQLIESQSVAEAMRIRAQALGDAERIEAQGKKDAAKVLESSKVAVDLARLERTGALVGDKNAYYFGAGPQEIPAMLANQQATSS